MSPFVRRPWLAGLLVALPIAAVAAWFAATFLGPTAKYAVDLGPARELAFALATVLAGVALAGRMAREELGTFSGLVACWALGHGLALALTAAGNLLLGEFAEDGALLAFLLSAVVSLGATLLLWIPAGIVWGAAVRRLTIPGLHEATEMELAESEAARDAAAREHVRFDATTIADQGSKLRRNRT